MWIGPQARSVPAYSGGPESAASSSAGNVVERADDQSA
jgi:hypothetical protein